MHTQTSLSKFLLIFTSLFVAITVLAVLPDQDHNGEAFVTPKQVHKAKGEQRPVATLSASLPADPQERALRQARNSRYDQRFPTAFDALRPDTKTRSRTSHWWIGMPALPTAESDAVILGKVVDAKGYLSNDKTGAYSEFTIRIKKVFKDDNRLSGGVIVAEREGADVQLSDGRIIRYEIIGRDLPVAGHRYVLFLKYNEKGKDYEIITGYELLNKRVIPLETNLDRFTAYKNSDKNLFLSAVSAAVENPPQAPEEKRKPNR